GGSGTGGVIFYADRTTGSMRKAVEETERRRAKQLSYNEAHGITPQTVVKQIHDLRNTVFDADYYPVPAEDERRPERKTSADPKELVESLRQEMYAAAERLEFERAADLRDRIKALESGEDESRPSGRAGGPAPKGGRSG